MHQDRRFYPTGINCILTVFKQYMYRRKKTVWYNKRWNENIEVGNDFIASYVESLQSYQFSRLYVAMEIKIVQKLKIWYQLMTYIFQKEKGSV